MSAHLSAQEPFRHICSSRTSFLMGRVAVADWTIEGTGPDGSEVMLSGSTADVAVHDVEHGWRYAIDNPFGTA